MGIGGAFDEADALFRVFPLVKRRVRCPETYLGSTGSTAGRRCSGRQRRTSCQEGSLGETDEKMCLVAAVASGGGSELVK